MLSHAGNAFQLSGSGCCTLLFVGDQTATVSASGLESGVGAGVGYVAN